MAHIAINGVQLVLPQAEVNAVASSTYTREIVARRLSQMMEQAQTAESHNDRAEAAREIEFLLGVMKQHGWE